jgi:hypothetical protein
MTQRPRSRRISFVTGIDQNFFLMCGILMESLERHFPLIPLYVMDFGLSAAQEEFFRTRGMLLPLPAGLNKKDHPFKLKSCLGAFIGEDFGVPIWIDADVMALRDGTQTAFDLADTMQAKDQRFAVVPDQGADGDLPTLLSNTRKMNMPALAAFLREHPQAAQRPYLNAGMIVFREADPLADWRAAAEAFLGDTVWEQNALNSLCALAPDRVHVLDPRVWNIHGGMLDAIDAQGAKCAGQDCLFAHATSAGPQITWGEMDFMFSGSRYRNFVKFFKHPALNELQKNYMNDFLSTNLAELRELGILPAP